MLGDRQFTIGGQPVNIHKARRAAFLEEKRIHLLIQDNGQISADPWFQSTNTEIVRPFGIRDLKGISRPWGLRKTVAINRLDPVRKLQRGNAVCSYLDRCRLVVVES